MTPWGEAEAWDRLAATLDTRTFAHLWAWDRDMTTEHVYDHETDGL